MSQAKKIKLKKIQKEELREECDVEAEKVISGQLKKKIKARYAKKRTESKGLVIVKHLPHGFFEEQLKSYFEQFGAVTRVRLARSKRTGNSKGFAFIEFQYPEVAQVASETMNNYLMFKKLVKAVYVPPEKQCFNYFKSTVRKIKTKSGKYKWVSSKTASIQRKMTQHNDWSEENYTKRTNRQLFKIKKMDNKFSYLGIDVNQLIVPPKPTVTSKKSATSINTKESEIYTSNMKSILKGESKMQPSSNKKEKKTRNVSLKNLLIEPIKENSNDKDHINSTKEVTSVENLSSTDKYPEEVKSSSNKIPKDKGDRIKKNILKTSAPLLKSSNVEGIGTIMRKKHYSGIQKSTKIKKTTTKNLLTKSPKNLLQKEAIKELAKPLSRKKVNLKTHS